MQKARLTWFGHVKRMEVSRILRKTGELAIRRERPDRIKKDRKNRGME